MGEYFAKPKALSGAVLRRRPSAIASFRRERRNDEGRAIPDWGRIVLRRASSTTLR